MKPFLDRSYRSRIHSPYVFELACDQCWLSHAEEPEHVVVNLVGPLAEWLSSGDIEYATGYASTVSYGRWRRRGELHAYIVLYDLPTATMYRLMFT